MLVFALKKNNLIASDSSKYYTRTLSLAAFLFRNFEVVGSLCDATQCTNFLRLFTCAHKQGDRIWRISAQWAIIFFGLLTYKLQKQTTFLGYFIPRLSLCINLAIKWVGLHFGRSFHKHIWSHCSQRSCLHVTPSSSSSNNKLPLTKQEPCGSPAFMSCVFCSTRVDVHMCVGMYVHVGVT
jgi:hypothetical protein